jgi:Ca2+-binding RTX toxin-like protein
MAIFTGTSGDDHLVGLASNDSLDGGEGNDRIEGGDGSDYIVDGAGDDIAEGGEGNDTFNSFEGSDSFDGGAGDDQFITYRGNGRFDHLTLIGGAGRDWFQMSSQGSSDFVVDAGEGDDYLRIDAAKGNYVLTLGAGADRVALLSRRTADDILAVTIADFATGAAGDRLDFSQFFPWFLTGWDGNTNPFALGHARLVQSGADALVQIDLNGGGDNWTDHVRLAGVDSASLTYHNLGGFPADGSIPAGLTLVGTGVRDDLFGAAGDDSISGLDGGDVLYGGSGTDTISGGDGHDQIHGEGGNDVLDGGAGMDTLSDGAGNDVVRGGGDNDGFSSSEGGNDLLQGEGGDDQFSVERRGSDQVTVDGGDGNDLMHLVSYGTANLFTLSGGAGDDKLRFATMYGTAQISLGSGADEIDLTNSDTGLRDFGRLIVSDFQIGAGGDRLDFDHWLAKVTTWDQSENPFLTGHVGLVQNGADALLQVDWNGGGDTMRTVITFTGRNVADFASGNLDGFAADGSAPPGTTLIGTAVNETLTGGSGNDLIEGRGGTDSLNGMGGADVIVGGDDRDSIRGGTGNDRIDGGGGGDSIDGGAGDDEIHAGDGNDTVLINDGADTVWGGAGDDEIAVQISPPLGKTTTARGEAGADTLRVNHTWFGTHIVFDGGDGDDRIALGDVNGTATVTLGGGSDRISLYRNPGSPIQPGQITITDFAAGAGGDTIDLAGSLGDVLFDWDGSNPFTAGYLRLVQQGGDTLLSVDRDGAGAGHGFVTLLTLAGVAASGLTVANIGYSVPRLYVAGSAGNDVLLLQQGGDDTALGGAGNDVLYFGAALGGGDVADGGDGRDAVVLQGNYTLTLSETNLVRIESISIQSGANATFGDTANNSYDYDLTTADGNVAAGQQLIVNGQSLRAGEDFTFDGSAESDGRFLVYGGHGVDDLTGGDGADVFFFEGVRWGADDEVNGGDGRDALVISGGSGTTHIEFAADALTSIESISLNNRFATDPTQKPSYELVLHNGNVAAGGTLIVNGSSIPGGQQVIIDGRGVHGGNLTLFAGGGHDVLTGGDGADLIVGGAGADSLTGGGGADTFRYDAASDSVGLADLIGDFQSGLDRIDLSRIDADTIAGGNQAFSWIGSNAFSGSAGELRTYEADGYRLVEGDTDGNGLADFVIGFQVGTSPLVQGDFLL